MGVANEKLQRNGGPPTPPGRYLAQWNLQMIRAKMFDDLIGNEDPNLGNWLVDPSWNLILIDHSRTFRYSKSLTHELTHIDRALWDRMKALTRDQLATRVRLVARRKGHQRRPRSPRDDAAFNRQAREEQGRGRRLHGLTRSRGEIDDAAFASATARFETITPEPPARRRASRTKPASNRS